MREKLVVASNNAGKIREIKAILGQEYAQIISMKEAGILLEVDETGDTFEENAKLKASACAQLCTCDVLADDSGIQVDALGGRPGVHSARYSQSGRDDDNNAKLLCELENVPDEARGAQYACMMVLIQADGTVLTGFGTCRGTISRVPAGSNGFGYDPYFYLPEYGCTMAELPEEKKNEISHRRRALDALLRELKGE